MRPTRDALLSRIPLDPLGGPNPAAYRDARPARAKHPDRRHWFETVGPSAANFGPPRPPTLTHHSTYSKRSYPYTRTAAAPRQHHLSSGGVLMSHRRGLYCAGRISFYRVREFFQCPVGHHRRRILACHEDQPVLRAHMAFRPAGKGGIFPVGFVVTHLTWLGLRLLKYYIPDRVE